MSSTTFPQAITTTGEIASTLSTPSLTEPGAGFAVDTPDTALRSTFQPFPMAPHLAEVLTSGKIT